MAAPQEKMTKIQGIGVSGILLDNGRALIIRRSPEDSEPGYWEFPKGKVEFDEHPNDAILREYEEETGLRVKIKGHLGIISWGYKRDDRQYHVAENIFEVVLDKDEKLENLKLSPDHDKFRWVDAAEVKSVEPMVSDRRDWLIKTLKNE